MRSRRIALLLFFPLCLFAHKVNLFGELSGDTLYLNGYFAGGGACKECKVLIRDKESNLILEEKLDQKGEATLHVPILPALFVELDASLGHKTVLQIKNSVVVTSTRVLEEKEAEPKTHYHAKPEGFEWYRLLSGFALSGGIFGAIMLLKRRR